LAGEKARHKSLKHSKRTKLKAEAPQVGSNFFLYFSAAKENIDRLSVINAVCAPQSSTKSMYRILAIIRHSRIENALE
jgi:hypothetical protein